MVELKYLKINLKEGGRLQPGDVSLDMNQNPGLQSAETRLGRKVLLRPEGESQRRFLFVLLNSHYARDIWNLDRRYPSFLRLKIPEEHELGNLDKLENSLRRVESLKEKVREELQLLSEYEESLVHHFLKTSAGD